MQRVVLELSLTGVAAFLRLVGFWYISDLSLSELSLVMVIISLLGHRTDGMDECDDEDTDVDLLDERD